MGDLGALRGIAAQDEALDDAPGQPLAIAGAADGRALGAPELNGAHQEVGAPALPL